MKNQPSKEISLRDHFAGLALQSLMAASLSDRSAIPVGNTLKIWTETAYRIADVMIEGRNNGNN